MKKLKNSYVIKNELFAKRYKEFKQAGFTGKIDINSMIIKNYTIYGRRRYHTFFGYYDLQQLNSDNNKILVLQVGKNANPRYNKAKVFFIDLLDGHYHFICTTRAWCWQQGARVRWCDDDNNFILVNKKIKNSFVCQKINIYTKKVSATYPIAFYDFSFSSKIGLSLDFSRLQTMRPGYGYSSIKDKSISDIAPKIGITKFELNSNTLKNIISLEELSKDVDSNPLDHHYINHISISPDGTKFIFFHLWARNEIDMWKMRLLLSDMDGNVTEIERNEIISHYCWINNDELLVTRINKKKDYSFIIYNLTTGERRIINNNYLVQDGHPCILKNRNDFITDTYPDESSFQEIFISNIQNGDKKIQLIKIFSDPRLYIEKRCDLHPRLKNKILTIDSTFSDGVRKVLVMDLIDDIQNKKTL